MMNSTRAGTILAILSVIAGGCGDDDVAIEPDAARADAAPPDADIADGALPDAPDAMLPDGSIPTCEPRVIETPGFFVAPRAEAGGDGSAELPFDLAEALAHPSAVTPGDTIWVREGIYHGTFMASLAGEAGMPITLRAYPGERVVIDGTLAIDGRFAIYRDLEIMSSEPTRTTEISGSSPADLDHRGKGVTVGGPSTRLVNCVIHDGNGAMSAWSSAPDAELYGNIVFNGGWIGPDRGHGHALYTQNRTGEKHVRDNIMFNQFGRGVQAYGSARAFVEGFRFVGNVVFNEEFLVGGENGLVATDIVVRENLLYNGRIRMGFSHGDNGAMAVVDNVIAHGGTAPLFIQRRWSEFEIARNRVYGASRLAYTRQSAGEGRVWDGNAYASSSDGLFEVEGMGTMGLEAWRTATGFDATSTASSLPTSPEIIVRPNEYEEGRAHVVIYNWDERDEVVVDLSDTGLRIGERYELRNVQNYFEEALTGTYDGEPVRVRMTGWTVSSPIGRDEPIEPVTFPGFGVFLLRSLGC